jgi:DNA-directed RNA polymerase specialized sigma24 family protein
MDRSRAIELLPANYALALQLRDAGRESAIADHLRVPLEAVPALLRLAETKLARLMMSDQPPHTK